MHPFVNYKQDIGIRWYHLFLFSASIIAFVAWYLGPYTLYRICGGMAVSKATLRSGGKMPMLGLGTFMMKPSETKAAVMAAIDAGYRHIDCADDYENEAEVGDAIQSVIKDGKVERKDVFITSKLWLTNFAPKRVKQGFNKSLKKLKLEYLDLYLLHFPFAMKPSDDGDAGDLNSKMDESVDYVDTWRELIKLQEAGLAKAIGVSNFNEFQMKRLAKETAHAPDVNQFECHPYLDQEALVKFCQSQGVVVTGYCPLGSAHSEIQKGLFDEPVLQAVAKKHNKAVPQVLLRYQIQLGVVVIPKSATSTHIESNAEIFDFSLEEEDMAKIKALNKDLRAVDVDGWASREHKYYPFRKDYSE